jgi:hypothetical protein
MITYKNQSTRFGSLGTIAHKTNKVDIIDTMLDDQSDTHLWVEAGRTEVANW